MICRFQVILKIEICVFGANIQQRLKRSVLFLLPETVFVMLMLHLEFVCMSCIQCRGQQSLLYKQQLIFLNRIHSFYHHDQSKHNYGKFMSLQVYQMK